MKVVPLLALAVLAVSVAYVSSTTINDANNDDHNYKRFESALQKLIQEDQSDEEVAKLQNFFTAEEIAQLQSTLQNKNLKQDRDDNDVVQLLEQSIVKKDALAKKSRWEWRWSKKRK